MSAESVLNRIKDQRFIAILRGNYPADGIDRIAEILRENEVHTLEITLNTSDALGSIARLRQRFGDTLLVGAGTVRTVNQWHAAIDAGAEFTVAPAFDPGIVVEALQGGRLHLPGVVTPTEAEIAFRSGCKALKLFPADVIGGPAFLKALRAPLDDIDFIPTGGISAANVADWFKAGATAVGLGSWLVGVNNSLDEIAARAQALHTSIREA